MSHQLNRLLSLSELITDCKEQVNLLNSLPLNVVDESLEVFRENIFSLSGRKQIPHLIYEILERQMIKEEHNLIEETEEAISE
jgi:hypothetical protein